jgi:hypothetical protein
MLLFVLCREGSLRAHRGLTNRWRTNRGLTEGLKMVQGELAEGTEGSQRSHRELTEYSE